MRDPSWRSSKPYDVRTGSPIPEVADGFPVAYYHSNGTGICLNSAKITKVRYDELLG